VARFFGIFRIGNRVEQDVYTLGFEFHISVSANTKWLSIIQIQKMGVLSIYRFSDLIQLLIWGIRRLDEDL
jgi:hypothetical protein